MITSTPTSPQSTAFQPAHVNVAQWHQAVGYARAACARIFRDGGTPADALSAFGIEAPATAVGWSKAVERIAEMLCATPARRAA
jgi:hypothetical protein